MKLAVLIQRYEPQFMAKYQYRLRPEHRRAMHAIKRCRTPHSGTGQWRCRACDEQLHQPRSCGHRSCPQCQNHETTQWLDRQQANPPWLTCPGICTGACSASGTSSPTATAR